MKVSRSQMCQLIMDSIDLDVEKGDVILTGKFKNKRQVVKGFGTDDLGQPTINGMKALKFRIEKLMPKEKWSKKSKEEAEEVNEMKSIRRRVRRIIRENLPPWMIDAIRQREEKEERTREQGRRLPLHGPPPPEDYPEEEEEEDDPRGADIIDYRLKREGKKVKITKRQLKRIIREEHRHLVEQGDLYDIHDQGAAELAADYEDRFDDDQKDMDYYLAVAIEKAVRDNAGIAGLDLVDLVKQDSLFGGTTRDDIFNMLDEMIEDGTLWGDFEEDAWYIASDTPHGQHIEKEWDII